MLPYSIFSQPWILKRSPLQVSASPVVCSEQWFRFGSSFAHYCPEAIEYSSQQFRIYPPCLWLFGHWPLFFLCLPPSLVGQKKKKRSEKRKSDTVLPWIIRPTKLSPWLAVEFVSHPSFQTWRWQLSSVSSRCQVIRIIPWGVSLHPLELLCFWCPEPFKAEGVFLLPGCNYEVLLRFCRFYLQVPDSFTTQPVSVK